MPESIPVLYVLIGNFALLGLCAVLYSLRKQNSNRSTVGMEGYDEYFHRLFDETAIAYHDIDMAGTIRRVNRAECDLLGFEPDLLVGMPVWQLVAPEAQADSRRAVIAKLARETPLVPFQRDYISRDGRQLTLEIHENILFDQ